ncbi:uncharacterized protein TNCV_1526571 [Trichonephila clavipes]|nr:uncharacterized protein TNCV_1526571 [Trichonephila clavipes]
MAVVSDPCSCQPDCLVCGRREVPPQDCAIHVLLESMVFQERMLHGEPTEARLEEILQSGKEYLSRAMHLTDQNSVHCLGEGPRLYRKGRGSCPPWMDFLVSSRIPPLVVTRVSRPPTFLSDPLERRPQYFAGPSPYIGWMVHNCSTLFSFIAHQKPLSASL